MVQKIVNNLIDRNIINKEDKEIHEFGLELAISKSFNLLLMFLVGLFLGIPIEAGIFLISYGGLRIYTGGYHSDTPGRCYITSWLLVLSVMLTLKIVIIPVISMVFLTIISVTIILFFSPVENMNKYLDVAELIHYWKKASQIAGINVLVLILCTLLDFHRLAQAITLSLIAVSVLMLLGLLKNHRQCIKAVN